MLFGVVLLPLVVAWAPAASLSARPQPFTASRHAVGAPSRTLQHALTLMAGAPFNETKAVLAAGFAFEAYNEPNEQDSRWERGADGCDVAFMSENFAREVYAGRLEVRLVEAKELTTDQDMAQALMSGGSRDPYVIFALNEENDKGPKEGAIGLGRAVDRARSSTVWSKSVADQAKEGLQGFFNKKEQPAEGSFSWPGAELLTLYVKDPSRAQLALTVFDEEVGVADIALGAASVHLADLLKPNGNEAQRAWSGWLPLTWRPAETNDNVALGLGAGQLGFAAGAMVAGPVGAAAGAFLGSLVEKPVQGEIRLELKYTPLLPLGGATLAASQEAREAEAEARDLAAAAQGVATLGGAEAAQAAQELVGSSEWKATLSSGVAKGGSEGVDWSTLARRVGTVGTDDNAQYELCCFLTHRDTSSEAAIWRDVARREVVIAFRGTSDILDVLTDVNFVQTPLEQGFNGQKSDDDRKVHSGFFAAASAVSRRVKELLVSATAGTPGDWTLLITGHSLGGALAQLMATELVGSVDVTRGFKEKDDGSLFGMAKRAFTATKQSFPGMELPKWESVSLYTYGAPRVGNSQFAAYFETLFAGREAYRIVNDRDIVARLPRSGTVAGAVLDYEHVGKTVLVAETAKAADSFAGFWVEGSSDEAACPLRDVSPLSNPFSEGSLLGDVGADTASLASDLSNTWNKIDAAAKMRSRADLGKAMADGFGSIDKAKASITGRVAGMSAGEALSMIGLDKRFVESEIEMVQSLTGGTAIEHHLEPSYFVAMATALDASQGPYLPAPGGGQDA